MRIELDQGAHPVAGRLGRTTTWPWRAWSKAQSGKIEIEGEQKVEFGVGEDLAPAVDDRRLVRAGAAPHGR